jgi:Domain of unknown function (DUF4347)/RTX calcium-binding nonapeptide repeat (4 copies)
MNSVATANSLVSAGASSFATTNVLDSLVVFDSRLSDLDVLYEALLPSSIGHTIGATDDALVEITRLLAETGAKHLALVAHGEPGIIHLGRESIDLGVLGARSGLLQEWCLAEISLYSCEVGASAKFVQQLALVTGSAVFAANTQLGAGNWDLTVKTGQQEIIVPWLIAEVMGYSHILADVFATGGVDIFNGLGGDNNTTSDNDLLIVGSQDFLNNGDVFSGGNGFDEINIVADGGALDFTTTNVVLEGFEVLSTDSVITLSPEQFARFGSIDLSKNSAVLNIKITPGPTTTATTVDISLLSAPVVSILSGAPAINLIGSIINDTIILTGEQLNAILGGASRSIDLGAGRDTINLTSTSTALNNHFSFDQFLKNVEVFSATSAAAGVEIDLNNQQGNFILVGSTKNDTITGGSGNDTIQGFVGTDIVSGGGINGSSGGIDTIVLAGTSLDFNQALDDQIVRVEAISAANASAGVTIDLRKQSEFFTITGSNLGDVIHGGSDNDTINGFTGVIVSTTGGAEPSPVPPYLIVADTVDGGIGYFDTIALTATSEALNLAGDGLISNVEVVSAASNMGGVNIRLVNQTEDFSIIGGASHDMLAGGSGNDTIDGGANGAPGDIAAYRGARSTYSIERIDGTNPSPSWIVTDNDTTANGNDGRDTLINIENINFSNQ